MRNTARDPRDNPGWVSALHLTSNGDVLVGCGDGKLILFSSYSNVKFAPPEMCSRGEEHHGEIVGLYYHTPSKLLVVGFAGETGISCGRVHIHKCTQDIRSGLTSQWRRYCCRLTDDLPLYVLECVSTSDSALEVWCGSNSSNVEVWTFPVRSDVMWTADTVEKESTTIKTTQSTSGRDMTVKQMKLCYDSTMMIVLLYQPNSRDHAITFIDVKSKKALKSVPCTFPSKLINCKFVYWSLV